LAELALQGSEVRLDPCLLLVELVQLPPIARDLVARLDAVGDEAR
jgi:hypothetical protein